jgi:pimeloyl-ACP methyl ester carboxylesterase
VIVPHLRGYGTTRFLSGDAVRNGQPSALAADAVALLDALKIDRATIGGFDWGARTANIVAALWPERCKAIVVLLRDRARPRRLREVPARLRQAGLAARVAEMDLRRRHVRSQRGVVQQPGSVAIVIHNYRWRLGLADGEPKYDDLEKRLAEGPVIAVPTITLEGDANGAPHPDPSAYAKKFSGKYAHRLIKGGVGHNLPQEAPHAFAKAVVDVDRF